MANKINQEQIIISSKGIVCTETSINLSNEKLINILSRVYERARKDANKFKFYKHFGVFLSISFTLLITLLTASFNDIGYLSGNVIRTVCIIVCVITFIIGFVFLVLYATKKDAAVNVERDSAVNDIMNNLAK